MEDFVARNSRWRLLLHLAGTALFVLSGLWMGGMFGAPPSSRRYPAELVSILGWLCAIFFGALATVAVKRLFGPSDQLTIGRSGVRYRAWSDATIPLSEISNVTTWSSRGQRAIVLHVRDRNRFPGRGLSGLLGRLNRTMAGADIFIMLSGTDRRFEDAMAAIQTFRGGGVPKAR